MHDIFYYASGVLSLCLTLYGILGSDRQLKVVGATSAAVVSVNLLVHNETGGASLVCLIGLRNLISALWNTKSSILKLGMAICWSVLFVSLYPLASPNEKLYFLPITACIIATFAYFILANAWLRMILFCTCLLWVIYGIENENYFIALTNAISGTFCLYAAQIAFGSSNRIT